MADAGGLLAALFGAAQRYLPSSAEDGPVGTAGMFFAPPPEEVQGAQNAVQDWWAWRNQQGWVPSPADVATGIAPMGMAGTIRAYHGSPHDFSRFDLEKIGTGEGAQAFGHGLYFAGNRKVAESYREALAPGAGTTPRDSAARWLKQAGGDADAARAGIRQQIERAYEAGDMQAVQDLQKINGHLYDPQSLQGRLYEVELRPNEQQLLDWDAPIGQQPEAVKAALDRLGIKDVQGDIDLSLASYTPQFSTATGSNAYQEVASAYGSPEAASRALSEAGVPGIRYLDGGSRSAGEGSRNYVMFNADDVKILQKLGLLAPLFGLGAYANPDSAEQQQPTNGAPP